jgi:predicted N-acetyltransferase YhbS
MALIRPATASDLQTLENLQRDFYGADFDSYHPALAAGVTAGHVWVAADGERLLGYLAAELFGPEHKTLPNSVFLSDLYVVPEARKLGLGKGLVEAFLTAPWPSEYPSFTLTHDPAEPHLTPYYERFGFREDGRTAAGNVVMRRSR